MRGRQQLLLKIPTNSKYARQGIVPGTIGTGVQHFNYTAWWTELYASCTRLTPEQIAVRLFPANGAESAKIYICVGHFLPHQFDRLADGTFHLRRGELPQNMARMFNLAPPPRPNRREQAQERRDDERALAAVASLDDHGPPTLGALLAQQQQHAGLLDLYATQRDALRLVWVTCLVTIFRCLLMWSLGWNSPPHLRNWRNCALKTCDWEQQTCVWPNNRRKIMLTCTFKTCSASTWMKC